MGDGELDIDGYVMFRRDRENQRSTGHGAGGVLLYVKSDIEAVERKDLSNDKSKENVWCEIQNGGKKLSMEFAIGHQYARRKRKKGYMK